MISNEDIESYIERASVAYLSILIDTMKKIFDDLAILEQRWKYLYPDERKAYWSRIKSNWKALYHSTNALAKKGGRPYDRWLQSAETQLLFKYRRKAEIIKRKYGDNASKLKAKMDALNIDLQKDRMYIRHSVTQYTLNDISVLLTPVGTNIDIYDIIISNIQQKSMMTRKGVKFYKDGKEINVKEEDKKREEELKKREEVIRQRIEEARRNAEG